MTNLTCSLAISKGLAEAGIKLETEFWWRIGKKTGQTIVVPCSEFENANNYKWVPAPLTDELLAILPRGYITINQNINEYYVGYGGGLHSEKNKSLPDALGKMAICLKKEGVIG